MAQHVTVKVKEMQDDHVVLELPNGTQCTWPLTDKNKFPHSVGDELILTLTSSTDVINELISSHE